MSAERPSIISLRRNGKVISGGNITSTASNVCSGSSIIADHLLEANCTINFRPTAGKANRDLSKHMRDHHRLELSWLLGRVVVPK